MQGIRRLHVVVTVDQNGRLAGHVGALGPDDRMRFAGEELHLGTPQTPEVIAQPFGRVPAVRCMTGIGGDAGNPEEDLELVEEARTLTEHKGVDGRHAENIRGVPDATVAWHCRATSPKKETPELSGVSSRRRPDLRRWPGADPLV